MAAQLAPLLDRAEFARLEAAGEVILAERAQAVVAATLDLSIFQASLTFCIFWPTVTGTSGCLVALSRSDAETIRGVVRRLRAEHAEREAAAIERLMQQALVSTDATAALSGYMTTGEAAALIGVSLQTIKNWVRQGRLMGARVGGRTLVTRASVQAFFDALPSAPEQAEQGEVSGAEAADRELMASLPDGLVRRVETLLDRVRAGQALSRSEQQELRRLARAGSIAATRHTRDRLARRQHL